MKEKRNIKLRTDMYEDTKFKIIDTMLERDTINYIWTRLLTLCGKVNDIEGRLYVTKNMPYTIEILAVEFNRTVEQIEKAIKVFINLNMVSREVNGVFKICNWAKYQDSSRKNRRNKENNDVIEINKYEEDEKNKDNSDYEFTQELEVSKSKPKEKINRIKKTKNVDNESNSDLNENKVKIIDITNTNLVKNKNELGENKSESITNLKKKKTRLKRTKKVVENSNIIITDEDKMKDEVIEFTETLVMPKDYRSVAVFDFT